MSAVAQYDTPIPERRVSESDPVVFRIGGDVWINRRERTVTARNGKAIPFTPYEYALFCALARHACKDTEEPLPRDQWVREVYGEKAPAKATLLHHLHEIRDKLHRADSLIEVRPVYGKGLKLVMIADRSNPGIYAPE